MSSSPGYVRTILLNRGRPMPRAPTDPARRVPLLTARGVMPAAFAERDIPSDSPRVTRQGRCRTRITKMGRIPRSREASLRAGAISGLLRSVREKNFGMPRKEDAVQRGLRPRQVRSVARARRRAERAPLAQSVPVGLLSTAYSSAQVRPYASGADTPGPACRTTDSERCTAFPSRSVHAPRACSLCGPPSPGEPLRDK